MRLIATAILLVIAVFAGKTWGEIHIKDTTVVRSGSPFYRGTHFGECEWTFDARGSAVASTCATNTPDP